MIEIRAWDGTIVAYVPDPCEHENAVPVISSKVVVAYLCPSCDEQLPEFWKI